jgi:acetyltransferase
MSLLETLFAPRRVALVGASDRAGSLGQLLVRNLQEYAGEVVQVRSGGSLRDVEGHIDLAVVAVPAAAAPAVAAEAAAVGVSAMVVLSGGFAETGPQGASLQRELLAAAASGPPAADGHPTRVRVIGPNCFGLQNCDLGFNASIAAGLPTGGGGISLVTQSGAYGMAIYDLAHDDHVRFAKVCAPGNPSDVTVTELVGELADDPATRTLCLLVESLPDGRAFAEQAVRRAADASWCSRPAGPRRGPVPRSRTPRPSPRGRRCGATSCVAAARSRCAAAPSCSTSRARSTLSPCRAATASASSRTRAAPGSSSPTCSPTRVSTCPS